MHFAEPPDQTLDPRTGRHRRRRRGRAGHRVRHRRGQGLGQGHARGTGRRCRAGRFIVHGQHDRARVPPNKLGIEIEAALAFGTGHHGTTRGCLLLLDHVLKALPSPARARSRHRHRRARDRGGEGAASARCWRATSIRSRCGSRATTLGSTGPAIWCRSIQRDRIFGAAIRQHAARSIWCWRIFSPIRCGRWRRRWPRHLAPSALVILSGLLPHQAQGVIAAYRARGLVLVTAPPDRRLEQPVDAQRGMRIDY